MPDTTPTHVEELRGSDVETINDAKERGILDTVMYTDDDPTMDYSHCEFCGETVNKETEPYWRTISTVAHERCVPDKYKRRSDERKGRNS